jgi:hypothetical protein
MRRDRLARREPEHDEPRIVGIVDDRRGRAIRVRGDGVARGAAWIERLHGALRSMRIFSVSIGGTGMRSSVLWPRVQLAQRKPSEESVVRPASPARMA